MPSMRIEPNDSESGHLQIPLDAPSWVTMWAFRQVRPQGWHTVDPTDFYEESGDSALIEILPWPGPVREIISTPIQSAHRGPLLSLRPGSTANGILIVTAPIGRMAPDQGEW